MSFPTVATLPFLYHPIYQVLRNQDDHCVSVTLPTSLQIGPFYYKIAYVSQNNFPFCGND